MIKKIKVMYDYQIIIHQNFGGISRYIYDLVIFFSKTYHVYIPVIFSKNYYFESYFKKKRFKKPIFNIINQLIIIINQFNSVIQLIRIKPDIFHVTYYNSYFIPFLPRKTKLIVTAHDMIHEIYPNLFKKWDFTSFHKKIVFNRANHIIAISNNTKNDLIKFYNVDNNKISIVYHGISLEPNNITENRVMIDDYILFVGQRDKYKNFNIVLNALSKLTLNHPIKLLCVGGKAFNHSEQIIIDTLKLNYLVIQKDLTEDELSIAYKNAICMIYPSLYEGFGLPILEAWKMKCPLILSNISCFKEIAQDAALFFNPLDDNDLKTKIELVLSKNEKIPYIIEKGNELLLNFSIDKMRNNTLDVYTQVLNKQ